MIFTPVEQGSAEWHQLRIGIPTASCFHRIVTPKGKLSEQSRDYRNELLAEWLYQSPLEQFEGEWMIHGHEFEQEAAAVYEFDRNVSASPGGFFTTDDGMIGASPDRLVGNTGVLEIKCPKANTHVGYMLSRGVDEKYRCQVQGQLWVCERDKSDMVSYCPGLPTVIITTGRDEAFIDVLSQSVREFVERILEARRKVSEEFGVNPAERSAKSKTSESKEGLGINEDLDWFIKDRGLA